MTATDKCVVFVDNVYNVKYGRETKHSVWEVGPPYIEPIGMQLDTRAMENKDVWYSCDGGQRCLILVWWRTKMSDISVAEDKDVWYSCVGGQRCLILVQWRTNMSDTRAMEDKDVWYSCGRWQRCLILVWWRTRMSDTRVGGQRCLILVWWRTKMSDTRVMEDKDVWYWVIHTSEAVGGREEWDPCSREIMRVYYACARGLWQRSLIDMK